MSSITNDSRAAGVDRARTLRAADGVIAGYIHSLVRAATPVTDGEDRSGLGRLASQLYGCGAGRSNGLATRRRLALRRAPLAA